MTTLTWLDLSFNRLQGPLPGSWNQMGSLTNLTLSFNNFTVRLASARRMWCKRLQSPGNVLVVAATDRARAAAYPQGPLPSAWLDATVPHLQLQAFACAHCNLSGLMPPWGDPNTCGTEAMQHFNVSGNTLSGSVPDSMAAWGSLLSFDVSQNRLSGGVFGGGSTCDLLSLVTLKLAGNLFNGTIPAGVLILRAVLAAEALMLVVACRTQTPAPTPAVLLHRPRRLGDEPAGAAGARCKRQPPQRQRAALPGNAAAAAAAPARQQLVWLAPSRAQRHPSAALPDVACQPRAVRPGTQWQHLLRQGRHPDWCVCACDVHACSCLMLAMMPVDRCRPAPPHLAGFNCSTGALLPAHYCVNAPEAQCSYVPPMSGQGLLLKAFRDSIGMNDLGQWCGDKACLLACEISDVCTSTTLRARAGLHSLRCPPCAFCRHLEPRQPLYMALGGRRV